MDIAFSLEGGYWSEFQDVLLNLFHEIPFFVSDSIS